MTQLPFRLPDVWPTAHDAGAANRLAERFAELGRAEARLAKRAPVAAMLHALGGNSPFLADLAVRESAALRALIADGPDPVVAAAMRELATISPAVPRQK